MDRCAAPAGTSAPRAPRQRQDRRRRRRRRCRAAPGPGPARDGGSPEVFGSAASRRSGPLGPAGMAYIGDAVWELALRERAMLSPPGVGADAEGGGGGGGGWMAARQREVNGAARAEYQAAALAAATRAGVLRNDEEGVVRWGRNASVKVPSRLLARGADGPRIYKAATALECLIGHLHVNGGGARAQELIAWMVDAENVGG